MHGERYARKHKGVEDVQRASTAHKQARARLKKEETLKHLSEEDPSLLEEEGTTLEELQTKVLQRRRTLKEAAADLQSALGALLEVQDYFPEVCMHFKSGLPTELLAVWRPDLTLEAFESRETLTTGANHTVYKAKMDGRMYALKEFRLASDEGLKRLLREAAMLRKMRHPAIVEIVSVFEDAGQASKDGRRMLLQMPLFEHGTLDTWVASEAPSWRAVRTVLLDVAGALEHLHAASVVHCDVKPPNILIAPNCRGRLADFDISVDYTTRTSTTRFVAATKVGYTAGFDAPELPRYLCVSVCVCVCMYVCMYMYVYSGV
jgi:serine/threonine protein kinase